MFSYPQFYPHYPQFEGKITLIYFINFISRFIS